MQKANGNWKALAAGLACVLMPLVASAEDWSETSVGYRFGERFREPFIPFIVGQPDQNIKKDILNFAHVNGYRYGTNYFEADLFMSDNQDPAAGGTAGTGKGAQEIYLIYRHQLRMSKVMDKSLAFGWVRDLSLTAGFDWGTKDTAFGDRVRRFVVGPTINFDIPQGFLDASLLYITENGHCGTCGSTFGQRKDPKFDDRWGVAFAWNIPFGSLPLNFEGFLRHYGAKGPLGNSAPSAAETLTRSYLMYDVGTLFDKKNTIFVGVGYEYWKNKGGNELTGPAYPAFFGGAGQPVPGRTTRTPMLAAKFKF